MIEIGFDQNDFKANGLLQRLHWRVPMWGLRLLSQVCGCVLPALAQALKKSMHVG